jgi:tellurite resistance protein TerC
MLTDLLPWIVFNVFVFGMLAVDLGIFHRHAHEVTVREALGWTAVWIALALLFNAGIYVWKGAQPAFEFFTGYLIEKSLSVDNIFVFLLIFSYFRVPVALQHKVLFWGVFSALLMRAIFIAAGVTLLQHFHWVIYLFGAFLILTGAKMARQNEKEIHPEKNLVLRLFRRFMPVSENYAGDKFFVTHQQRTVATPLFVTLLAVETTDVVFAVDSIPAILAVTVDPFIVYTSNVFALLGLRALFFAVAGAMKSFAYLSIGLAVILIFVGIKMVLTDLYKIPIVATLAVIGLILLAAVVASRLNAGRTAPAGPGKK